MDDLRPGKHVLGSPALSVGEHPWHRQERRRRTSTLEVYQKGERVETYTGNLGGDEHSDKIAYRTRRHLQVDPKAERFIGDTEVNRLLGRTYRKPFVLPEKVR